MSDTEEKKAIRVLRDRIPKSFEDKCNELVQQGYRLQACGCNTNRWGTCSSDEVWFAVFGLTETITQLHN